MAGGVTPALPGSVYEQYLYSYPHKLAYAPIAPPRSLAELWAGERRDALFLYVHVPFCEQRCGFCNLFTLAKPAEEQHERYLDALAVQMEVTREALGGGATFAEYAIGGGTPTYLAARELAALFEALSTKMGLDTARARGSVEVSPWTATADRLDVLRERGVTRVSMGVQSFVESEAAALARAQDTRAVLAALERIRARSFTTLNLDLMYGIPGQTAETFLASLRAASAFRPEEIYLYPLYVRRLTVLGKRAGGEPRDDAWDEERLSLYRVGRAFLLGDDYEQVSMRMFRLRRPSEGAPRVYRCQRDGMVGLGPGARSYTEGIHYSTAYAVGAGGVRSILDGYMRAERADHERASWGFVLSPEEQRRRFVILSLFGEDGLSADEYTARFGSDPQGDLPELAQIASVTEPEPLVSSRGGRWTLTPAGVERSDQLGPMLMSARVRDALRKGPPS